MKRFLGVALAAVMVATTVLALPGVAGADVRFVMRVETALDGSQEVPAVETDMTGRVVMRLDQTSLRYRLSTAGGETEIVASHIHCGAPGENGPVGVSLFSGSLNRNGVVASGSVTEPAPGNACGWETINDVAAAIEAGAAYVNVHSSEASGGVPSGEIRGDLSPKKFRLRDDVRLDGAQENPAIDTDLTGRFVVRLNQDRLRFRLSVRNNSHNVIAAHIHCADPGANGQVGLSLFAGSFTDNGRVAGGVITAPEVPNGCDWTTLADVANAIQTGAAYVNVHTSAESGGVPGGEIRGNLG